MKITGFIIGLVFISLGAVVFGSFWGGLNSEYARPDYDNSTIQAFNKFDNLTDETQLIGDETENIAEKEGSPDILGNYLTSGYKALKITMASFSIFESVADEAAEQSGMGLTLGGVFKTAIITSVLIALIVGLIIAIMVKQNDL